MLLQEKFFNAILSESFCENSIPDTVHLSVTFRFRKFQMSEISSRKSDIVIECVL